VSKKNPLFLRKKMHQVLFNFLGSFFFGEIQPAGQPLYMGVDDHALGFAVGNSEYDVRGLSGYSG